MSDQEHIPLWKSDAARKIMSEEVLDCSDDSEARMTPLSVRVTVQGQPRGQTEGHTESQTKRQSETHQQGLDKYREFQSALKKISSENSIDSESMDALDCKDEPNSRPGTRTAKTVRFILPDERYSETKAAWRDGIHGKPFRRGPSTVQGFFLSLPTEAHIAQASHLQKRRLMATTAMLASLSSRKVSATASPMVTRGIIPQTRIPGRYFPPRSGQEDITEPPLEMSTVPVPLKSALVKRQQPGKIVRTSMFISTPGTESNNRESFQNENVDVQMLMQKGVTQGEENGTHIESQQPPETSARVELDHHFTKQFHINQGDSYTSQVDLHQMPRYQNMNSVHTSSLSVRPQPNSRPSSSQVQTDSHRVLPLRMKQSQEFQTQESVEDYEYEDYQPDEAEVPYIPLGYYAIRRVAFLPGQVALKTGSDGFQGRLEGSAKLLHSRPLSSAPGGRSLPDIQDSWPPSVRIQSANIVPRFKNIIVPRVRSLSRSSSASGTI